MSPEHQLHAVLSDRLTAMAALFGPTSTQDLATRTRDVAANTVLMLNSSDDNEAAGAATDVMSVLWPNADPERSGHPEWWHTPLGRLIARAGDHPSSDAVTHAVAAAMLGITRGAIPSLINRDGLDRHPDGGVTRTSVLARIASPISD